MLRKLARMVLLVLMATAVPSPAPSQEIDLRVGYDIPTGELADLESGGIITGLSLGFSVSGAVVLGGRVDVAFLLGKDRDSLRQDAPTLWPDLTAVHYVAEVRFRPSILPGWNLEMGVGAGGSTLSFSDAGSSTYPTLSGGLGGGVDLSEKVILIVGANTYLVFADSEDFEDLNRFGDTWFVGFTTGIRVKL
jgi:hypothetical protein